MSMGIDNVRAALKDTLDLINAEEKLRLVDFGVVAQEVFDLDDAEAQKLAADLQLLDLSNDELEAKVKAVASSAAPYAALALRILKMFVPKK